MATVITYNDFRYGMVSEYMRRRADLETYQKSASLIENAVPMRTGGVRLRPGIARIADLTSINAKRLIPFVISVREFYILVLSPKKLYIYGLGLSGVYEDLSKGGFEVGYTEGEIPEVQTAQSYDMMVFAHKNHQPIVVQKGGTGGWSVGAISLVTSTGAYNYIYDEDGNETKSEASYDYEGLFSTNNFPGTVSFHASRLWFGGSIEHPYRMWASKPFDYFNFQTMAYYNYVDEGVSVNQYLDAIAGAGETREELSDGNYWIVTKTVDSQTGTVTVFSAIQDEGGSILGHKEYDRDSDTWGEPVYDGKSWSYTFKYTKAVYSIDTITREDSAMMLDMAAKGDESISWLAANGNLIFVGTASSEWAMPSSINALSQTNTNLAAYGSASFIPACYGVRNIFYVQSGGKKLRTIQTVDGSPSFGDLSYQCPEMLSAGVKEMSWQRVPEPRLYCILKDGTLAVLCYDTDYGLNAWCRWTSDVLFRSVAVIDTEDGQEVFVLAERKDGQIHLCRFEDGVFTDDEDYDFTARIRTNNLDSSTMMLYTKKTFRIAADSMHTRFKARINNEPQAVAFNYSSDLVKLWNWTRPTDSGLRAEFESFPGEDMILLAVMIETEVSD